MWSRRVRGTVDVSVFVGSPTIAVVGLASGNTLVIVGAVLIVVGAIITWTLRSLHRLKIKCAELEDARSAAVAAVNDRDDRLAVVAHDLRTPLQAILLCTSAIADGTSKDQSQTELRILADAVDRMEHMIGLLLEVSRLEAGAFQVHRAACAVSTILDHVAAQFRLRFAAHATHLEFEHTEMMVMADRERVVEVISNLLDNALKHSSQGGRVLVIVRPLGHEARFSVLDNGPGIPSSDMSRLFERYWQARTEDGRGAGLGLYICKRLVEAHGGRIGAASTVGMGTEMWFTLPRVERAQRMDSAATLHVRSAPDVDSLRG